MRKNIFEVSQEEKERILKEHIRATNNNYLIQENNNRLGASYVARLFMKSGISFHDTNEVERNYTWNSWKVFLVDGAGWNNVWVEIYDNGNAAIYGRHINEGEKITGNWRLNANNCSISFDGKEIFNGPVDTSGDGMESNQKWHDGDARSGLFCFMIKNDKVLNWKTLREWPWMFEDVIDEAGTCASELQNKIKEADEKYGGFWRSSWALLPEWLQNAIMCVLFPINCMTSMTDEELDLATKNEMERLNYA